MTRTTTTTHTIAELRTVASFESMICPHPDANLISVVLSRGACPACSNICNCSYHRRHGQQQRRRRRQQQQQQQQQEQQQQQLQLQQQRQFRPQHATVAPTLGGTVNHRELHMHAGVQNVSNNITMSAHNVHPMGTELTSYMSLFGGMNCSFDMSDLTVLNCTS